jgi:hypothetical protein
VRNTALLAGMDRQRLATVIRAKALGAWHELTRHVPLDAFVLFPSATSFVGNAGQANYAAANAFLDHLAAARRDMGLPALAVNSRGRRSRLCGRCGVPRPPRSRCCRWTGPSSSATTP